MPPWSSLWVQRPHPSVPTLCRTYPPKIHRWADESGSSWCSRTVRSVLSEDPRSSIFPPPRRSQPSPKWSCRRRCWWYPSCSTRPSPSSAWSPPPRPSDLARSRRRRATTTKWQIESRYTVSSWWMCYRVSRNARGFWLFAPGANFSFILGPVIDGGGGLNHLASDVQGPRCQEF